MQNQGKPWKQGDTFTAYGETFTVNIVGPFGVWTTRTPKGRKGEPPGGEKGYFELSTLARDATRT